MVERQTDGDDDDEDGDTANVIEKEIKLVLESL